MSLHRTLRQRGSWLLAAGAALCLVLAGQGVSLAVAARVLLGGAALAALGFWLSRRHGSGFASFARRRLEIQEQAGLGARTGIALVRVDGRELLIAFGEGFVQALPLESAPLRPLDRPSVQGPSCGRAS